MKFTVKFKTKSNEWKKRPARTEDREIGLTLLARLREELEMPSLALERVKDAIFGLADKPKLNLTEEQAEETGLFDEKNSVVVYTKPCELNFSVYFKVETEKDEKTGEILAACFKAKVDKEAVFEWWEENDFTLSTKEE